MSAAPDRPPSVPDQAVWHAEQEIWELASPTAENIAAELRLWRADGTLYLETGLEAGRRSGPFRIYHPNGAVAREGLYVGGAIHGEVTAYACEDPTPERLRSCCVPPGAFQMKARYDEGRLQRETFLDKQGRVLLSDGSPRPERPASVPEAGGFDEHDRRWSHGALSPDRGAFGPWRFWTEEGRLDEEAEYADGRKRLTRLFDGEGRIRQETAFDDNDVRHGPHRRRFDGGESPYADPRIREERGAFHHGQAVGSWTFHDETGAVVRAVDLGEAHDATRIAEMEVLRDGRRSADEWRALAVRLRAQGRTREALCAAARATAQSGQARELLAFLEETTVALVPQASAEVHQRISDSLEGGLDGVLGALVGGAEPAAALRTLASTVPGANQAALDFVQASLVLAPDRPMTYVTRALIRTELGDPAGAREDAGQVAAESPETAEFLRTYLRLLFPAFTFWPGREIPFSELHETMPDEPAQPVEAMRRTMAVYATRLALVRQALIAAVGELPSWLPPDVSALVPEGPVELRRYEAAITDETEEGPVACQVTVDEILDLTGASVPALMRLARGHWAGLCWLCWTAGLDRVALPEAIVPPANFAHAAGMAIARYWRAQDAVATGGLRAMTAGVAGFVWEDLQIDGIPRLFAELAADEMLEMRSVFLWLSSPENLSPFQSDLRKA